MAFDANEIELIRLLNDFGIDYSTWKSGKMPDDLLYELRAGESQLVLARLVEVVKMRVVRNIGDGRMQHLLELGKRLANGSEVIYSKPRDPSGKIRPGETAQHAFLREAWEELSLSAEDCSGNFTGPRVELPSPEDSRSFSGIWGIYRLYWFTVEVCYGHFDFYWNEQKMRYEINDRSDPGTTLYFAWSEPLLK